jgi:hypothetical protein
MLLYFQLQFFKGFCIPNFINTVSWNAVTPVKALQRIPVIKITGSINIRAVFGILGIYIIIAWNVFYRNFGYLLQAIFFCSFSIVFFIAGSCYKQSAKK